MSVVTQFVYPLLLTGVGILGNAYPFADQVRELRQELDSHTKLVQEEFMGVRGDVKGLLMRQAEQEVRKNVVVQKYIGACGKRWRGC